MKPTNIFMSCQQTELAFNHAQNLAPANIKSSLPPFNKPSDSTTKLWTESKSLTFTPINTKVFGTEIPTAIINLFAKPQFDPFRQFLNQSLKYLLLFFFLFSLTAFNFILPNIEIPSIQLPKQPSNAKDQYSSKHSKQPKTMRQYSKSSNSSTGSSALHQTPYNPCNTGKNVSRPKEYPTTGNANLNSRTCYNSSDSQMKKHSLYVK